jgi:WD40 repeat protein
VLQQTLEGHSSWVNSAAFSLDGKLIVSGSEDNTIRLWDFATRTLRQILKGHSSLINLVTFSPDGKLIVSGLRDNIVRL